ncbi:MAG: copper-containing nitrite reductase [Thermomicrobiales bacterium]
MTTSGNNLERITSAKMGRRSLLKRAGVLGLALPSAGAILTACMGADDDGAGLAEDALAAESDDVAQSAGVEEITVTAFDLGFRPSEVSVEQGKTVRLTFVNDGAMEHDIAFPDMTCDGFKTTHEAEMMSERAHNLLSESHDGKTPYAAAGAGDRMVIEFTPDAAGQYEMLCLVPGHAEAGMRGTFTVGAPAAAVATEQDDEHTSGSGTAASGAPYDAEALPNPVVAPPVGDRGPELVKVELEAREIIGKVDEGVAYEFWTFDGTVPGTMIRCRVDDTVELTLKNSANSRMTHNIDLHAVTGPGGGAKATVVAPGESATIRFKARHPGVFVYHCAVAPIPHHISAGMYGLIVVEPEGGFPEVDHEFYVMQGDLYFEGARNELGLRTFSMDKMLDERPDYVVFNGSVGSIAGERAFKAEVGDSVRIFFGVGGPNITSSYHVIGEIFDRVMPEGSSDWHANVQTTLVPAGGATVVEFTCEVPGTYVMVDHSLGRLGKGAAGMIEVEGEEDPETFEIVSSPGN